MIDGSAPLVSLLEGLGADRSDHELLDVDVGVGVSATVENVHHRNGEHVGVRSAQVLVERKVGRVSGSVSGGQGDTEDGVGAQLALVVRAVELDHDLVDDALLAGVAAEHLLGDLLVDVLNSLENALAGVALLVAVAQLNGLELTGRRAGGNRSAGLGAVVEDHLDLNGRVAAGVEDLTGFDEFDGCHGPTFQRGSLRPPQSVSKPADQRYFRAPRHLSSWPSEGFR